MRRANEEETRADNYSILVVPEGVEEGMSSAQALQYRQGNRLAVVVGRHPDLGSFNQSFQEVLGLNYPDQARNSVTLQNLSKMAVEEVISTAGVEASEFWDPSFSREFVNGCLERSAKIHESLLGGTESWNALWFEHVNIGFENLAEKLSQMSSSGIMLDDFFKNYTYASFGFSKPNPLSKTIISAAAFVDAYKTYWLDQQTILESTHYLEHHPEWGGVGAHPMSTVNWDNFDQTQASVGNLSLAFVKYMNSDPVALDSLVHFTDSQFLNPANSNSKNPKLTPFDELFNSLSIGNDSELGPFIAQATRADSSVQVISETLRIKIPAILDHFDGKDSGTKADLRSTTAKTSWRGVLEIDENGEVWACGNIEWNITKSTNLVTPKKIKLVVSVPLDDPLQGKINLNASIEISMVVMEQSGILAVPLRKNGSMGKPTHWFLDSDNQETTAIELDSNIERYRYVAWTPDRFLHPTLEAHPMEKLHNRPNFFVAEELTTELSLLIVGAQTFECRSAESSKASHSPIVTAISNGRPSPDPLSSVSMNSVRGIYEACFVREHDNVKFLDSLGHLVVAQDREVDILPDLEAHSQGLLMSGSLRGVWNQVSDFSVPQEILESEEAREFRRCFLGLGIEKRIDSTTGTMSWLPSKASWRELWEDDQGRASLESYLEAYAELVLAARRIGNAAALFWATYPFSISVWQTLEATSVAAVLLSPLHPIRLAWLAGVESTLWHSTLSKHLAGTVEGWNIPFIGPPESEDGRLIAVPLEAGEDQVFLGWSMLVRTSIEVPRMLVAPERAGNFTLPGTAVSGLNSTAVAAALKSYRRMNPHVSTMTIDLAANSGTARLGEIDEAVLSAVREWTSNKNSPLLGGARIWDSIKRSGKPPQEMMARLVKATNDVPLTWSRYVPDNADRKPCNVRILQDSGVRVKISSKINGSRLGTMGLTPLRRFEASLEHSGDHKTSISSPTLRENHGWEPLTRAIREFEGGISTTTLINAKLFQANLTDASADWTVSGESLISPSAMSAMVQENGSGDQMLWEWRPPFLEPSGEVPALERRPFISIARIPEGFKAQIRNLLSKAQGTEASDSLVRSLLSTLGARGVGLSSMLSMGGTHAAGALGFYLVFSLMEKLQSNEDCTLVLPIDACDSFLRALASGADHADIVRRADLLLLRIKDKSLTLAPIEIKFYGLNAESNGGVLPEVSDASMKEPLEQAMTTAKLLDGVAETWKNIRVSNNASDIALWSNGIAALTEAAMRLQPASAHNPDAMAKALSSLAEGKSDVVVGRPLVAYFKYQAVSANGNSFHTRISVPELQTDKSFGLLATNPEAAFAALRLDGSNLVEEWSTLVEWALEDRSNQLAEDSTSDAAPHSVSDGSNEDSTSSSGRNPREQRSIANEPTLPEKVSAEVLPKPESKIDEEGTASEMDMETHGEEPHSRKEREREVEYVDLEVLPNFENGIRAPGIKFPVGRVIGTAGERWADFWPGNTDLNQMNIGVVGDLGTGKTQLVQALIYGLRKEATVAQETPLSMLVFDYKQDFQEPEFLEAVGGKVLRINQIPLNFFQLREGYTAMAANQRTNEFIDVLDKIYGGMGPVQKDRLSTCIMDLYRENKKSAPTIGRVLTRYLEQDEKPDSVTAILRKFVNAEVFSEDQESIKSFEELIDNNVLIVALNDFGVDDEGKNALVIMFLNLYYDYMLKSKKWPFVGDEPQLRRLNSFLLVDEAVNIMKYKFPVLMNLLLQGRQFGFGVMLASQYLSHFKKDQENYGEPLLTWFLHKVKTVTAKELQQVGLSENSQELAVKMANLGKHQSIYRSLGSNGIIIEDIPFFRIMAEKNK
ncbi:hypothetical protein [Arthrobacter sp. MYb227]|uniref:hypothetical protein n=1 Tax=Arthrobacter sp. MYb227 TaxID=1848601 RepID=UPI0011AFED30|nr:hypothetical protein [Arthrobacter sp. MYb227]